MFGVGALWYACASIRTYTYMLSCFLACPAVKIFRKSVDDELKKVNMYMDSSYHDYLGHYLDDLENLCQGADKRKINDHLSLYSHGI